MFIHNFICIYVILSIFQLFIVEAAFRYENRTISCSVDEHGEDSCVLTAPDTKLNLDLNIKCRREELESPQKSKTGSKTRLACPIRCPKDYEVHVLQKIPSTNKKCIKYYTYGKYQGEEEWFVWMVEPCITTISTHCRFPEN